MKKAFYLILTGVAIGILVAPRKGSETWNKLKQGFEDWKEEMIDHANDVASESKDILQTGKSITENISSEFKEPLTIS